MRTIDGGEDFGVALLQIGTSVRLTEHSKFTLYPAQFPGTSPVQAESLV